MKNLEYETRDHLHFSDILVIFDFVTLSGRYDSMKLEQKTRSVKKSITDEVKALAIKTIILIVVVRASIWLFEIFAAPDLGLKHGHIVIGETMVTIAVSFVVISFIRRLLKRISPKIPSHFIANISFFSIVIISLFAALILLYLWGVQPQTILVGGGVAAIVVGIGVSTIVGNLFSGALMLTTFPAKIGDSIFVINDNVHGTIEDISTLYTTINTEDGREYLVPNSAIIQGDVRLVREEPSSALLPYVEGNKIEISNGSQRFSGIVININPRTTTILEGGKEIIISNKLVLKEDTVIKKNIADK